MCVFYWYKLLKNYNEKQKYIFQKWEFARTKIWLFYLPYSRFIFTLTCSIMQVDKQYFWFSDLAYRCKDLLVFLHWRKQHQVGHAKNINEILGISKFSSLHLPFFIVASITFVMKYFTESLIPLHDYGVFRLKRSSVGGIPGGSNKFRTSTR